MTASVLFALLFYLATALLVAGLGAKIVRYARTPAPLKIPTTPAPTTAGGVVWRMFREVAFFESLFKGNLWTWALGWAFHVSLALVLARHLRYFTEPVWGWVAALQPFGIYAGLAMVAALMIVFPFSKLLHAPGVFFSPTRNQVDNPREARHLAAWAARLERN